MVNLFRQMPAEQGGLTAALLALLEHSDPSLLGGLLEQAGIAAKTPPDAPVEALYPARDGPPGSGAILLPGLRLTVAAQAPGERFDAEGLAGAPGIPLAVTVTGKASQGVRALSWEQLDRWLRAATEQYGPEGRTGFLVRQFREYLPQVGIELFAGFEAGLLTEAPEALTVLGQFFQTAERFFDRLVPALSAAYEGMARLRTARSDDLLAGYCYSDFGGPPCGPGGFLRVALRLPQRELQTSLWVVPGGGDSHARLFEALTDDGSLLTALQRLEASPLLWLWSAGDERRLPLDDLSPDDLQELDWPQYHAAIQVSLPFDALAGEALLGRSAAQAGDLLEALAPVLTKTFH